ncbi:MULTISPECIES: SAR2788 family putative toxin [Aeribacillus]|uniref:SAR2788 family putative toxin n=1 Tax=Aeribacillus TaxID=1055323 RepID=UPI0007B472F4|nr:MULTISPECIES: SAR2788 family putative toxin [Aeribacillus]KZM54599.1 hypothetical protein A3Q35_14575 [Aeribacillus pallidus]MED0651391.1 SAR2788 family putative toxin [Aeribacillus composti]MED4487279.1 SAR2788 family putative toxin [Aeribacillus pallidus]
MKKFLSLLIIIVLLISNFSGVANIVYAESANNYNESQGTELQNQLLDFFTSEEFKDSIANTTDLSKEILDNSDVLNVISEDSNLVEEVLSNETIIDTIVEEPSLINKILENENVVNTIVNDSNLVNEVLQNDESINNILTEDESSLSVITEDIAIGKEVLKAEEVSSTIAEDPILVNEIFDNESIVNTIAEEPYLVTEVLTNDSVVQNILEDDKLIDTISSNENTVNTLLDNKELVDSLLNEREIVEEIKSDLINGYTSVLEDTLGSNASNINPTIQDLNSDGIELQLNIDTDEYDAELILDSSLNGNNITVSSKLDYGNGIEETYYDVRILKNTEEEFKVLLVDKQTGEEITISEDDAQASVVAVIVRIIGGVIKFFSKQTGKQVTKSAAKSAKKSFSSGEAGEKYLETLVKVKDIQVYKRTSLGGRYIDVLDTSGIAHESKVGYVTLTKTIKKQIDKDYLLIKDKSVKDVKGAKWHFFRSDKTGKVGASKSVKDYLKSKGISYKIYD